MALIKKLRKKKKEAPANEKPDVVKTHLRNMVRFDDIKCYLAILSIRTTPRNTSLFSIFSFEQHLFQVIVPEMTGSIVGVYNGKVFTQVRLNNPVNKSPPCKTHGLDSLCSLLCTYHGSEQPLCSQYGFLSCDGNSWQKWNKPYNFSYQNDPLKTFTFPPSLEPV